MNHQLCSTVDSCLSELFLPYFSLIKTKIHPWYSESLDRGGKYGIALYIESPLYIGLCHLY